MAEHKGNITDKLWYAMGVQKDAEGVERHGQSCFLYVYPTGTDYTRAEIAKYGEFRNEPEEAEPSGPIDAVMETVLQNSILCPQMSDDEEIFEYDGLRAGSGWIYGCLAVAKAHGATHASVGMHSNDGNWVMEAINFEKGVYVTAVHITYYGT